MGSLWRVSLQRMRADWPIVAAAWLITILSAVLFAAGVIYPSAASESGLQRALRDAAVSDRNVEVRRYEDAANALALDGQATASLEGALAGVGGSMVRDWQGSATFALVGGGRPGDQAGLGFLDGLADHATLLAGAWPTDAAAGSTGDPSGPAVVLAKSAADVLGVQVGDAVETIARPGSEQRSVTLRVVGIYEPADAASAFWDADEALLTGLHDNGQYRTFGPFLTTQSQLLAAMGDDELNLRWRLFPDFDNLGVDQAVQLRASLEGMRNRLLSATGEEFTLESGLPGILRASERSLLVSRTSVVLLMAQLALLAGYAIVLTATLLVDHRRVDTALLRARGAGSAHVALLSFGEGLVFAISAVVVAPTLAVAAVGVFNIVGPLADVGLTLEPRITPDAYAAAAAAGALSVVLLVLPAALSARAFAQEQGARSRQETRTFGQRLGLDVVLLAITGIALWQLRLYGAPITRSVQGELGLDPLLVAAPAIGMVAGGVLALRMLPLLAQAVEATVSRGRGFLAALGARQLARRPLRYTRSALLLVLSVSMGVFALSYAATWGGSQRDQATYQAGADVRMPARSARAGTPTWALAGALADLPAVAAATPVERIVDGLKFASAGSADLVAVDASTAGGVILLRDDASATPFEQLMQPLAAARPDPVLPALPDGTGFLRVVPWVSITTINQYRYDPETDEVTIEPLDPAAVLVQVAASTMVRDAHGSVYEFRSAAQSAGLSTVVPLVAPGAGAQALHLDGPVTIAGLRVEFWLPEESVTSLATFGIEALQASSSEAGPWTDVPLAGAAPWSAATGFGRGAVLEDVPANQVHDVAIDIDGDAEEGSGTYGYGSSTPALTLGFLPNGIDIPGGAVPIVVNQAFLGTVDADVGEVARASIGGRFLSLSITGVIESFPTTDPSRPLAIVDEGTLSLLRLRTPLPTRPVDEWWLAARDGEGEALAATLAAAPFERADVVSASGRASELSTDPVALGIIGALTLGFVTTGLFAIVGLTVSAGVSARQQRTEFALLRALGMSGRQLSGSLWLEHGSVVVLGLLAGTGIGLLVSWLVLPFVTVTQGGLSPVPSVIIEVPWDRVVMLNLVSALALGLAVLVIGAALRRLRVGSTLRMGEE